MSASRHPISTHLTQVKSCEHRAALAPWLQVDPNRGGKASPQKSVSTGKTCFSFPGNTCGTGYYEVNECFMPIL